MKAVYEVDEVAALLGISRARVYSLARQSLIPHLRLGRQLRFPIHAVQEWMTRGGTSSPEGIQSEAA